jgi:hypothetical protein
MLQAGCGMLGQLLAADPGYRGPRVPCSQGHEAGFVSYRDKVIDTALGPVTLTRAWYHCEACRHGFAPRDAELGVAGASLSPGLAAMNDRAAAAGPFAGAAGLLEDLAGVRLTAKRVERAAEASGAARAAAVRDLYHAREHLHDLARLLEFMLLDRKDEWLAARLEDPGYGDIDGICRAARAYPLEGIKKDQLETALGYFENNAPRMRYHWFRSRGLFVGSGVVESGCKSVIGQRLKLSGMHWTAAGADAITTLRCQQASRPEDQIWPTPRNQTPAA